MNKLTKLNQLDLPFLLRDDQQQWEEQSHVSTNLKVVFDDEIGEPSKYTNLINRIESLTENDQIELVLDTVGGNADATISLVNALQSTQANVMGVIRNRCYSAGSVLAMVCHELYISPYARMMIHTKTGGYFGKDPDLESDYEFNQKYFKNFFRDIYKHFLTDAEIEDVLQGRDIWIDAEGITSRLERKIEILEKEQKRQEKEAKAYHKRYLEAIQQVQEQDETQVKPVAKSAKKAKVNPSEQTEENTLTNN